MAFDIESFNTVSSGAAAGKRLYSYTTTTDGSATVYADDYFLEVGSLLAQNDLIYISTSDSKGWFYVSSASSSSVVLGTTYGEAHKRVTITSAQVLAMRATAVELLPAPGAGKMNRFDTMILQLAYNSSAYTEAGDNMHLHYSADSTAISSTIEATGFIDQTANTTTRAVSIGDAILGNSVVVNDAIVLSNVGGSEYAAGNSSLVADVYYRIVNAV